MMRSRNQLQRKYARVKEKKIVIMTMAKFIIKEEIITIITINNQHLDHKVIMFSQLNHQFTISKQITIIFTTKSSSN